MTDIDVDVPGIELPEEPWVLVCGGRSLPDRAILDWALDAFHAIHRIALLIHGGANGSDIAYVHIAMGLGQLCGPSRRVMRKSRQIRGREHMTQVRRTNMRPPSLSQGRASSS